MRGGERERVDMRQANERGMEEDTTGLRGVALSAWAGVHLRRSGSMRVDDRPQRTTPVGRQEGGPCRAKEYARRPDLLKRPIRCASEELVLVGER